MDPVYVYKLGATGNHPVARITLEDGKLTVETGEIMVQRVVEACLRQPALITERSGSSVVKRHPKDEEEDIVARLKRNMPKPYFLTKAPSPFPVKYTSSYPVQVLERGHPEKE